MLQRSIAWSRGASPRARTERDGPGGDSSSPVTTHAPDWPGALLGGRRFYPPFGEATLAGGFLLRRRRTRRLRRLPAGVPSPAGSRRSLGTAGARVPAPGSTGSEHSGGPLEPVAYFRRLPSEAVEAYEAYAPRRSVSVASAIRSIAAATAAAPSIAGIYAAYGGLPPVGVAGTLSESTAYGVRRRRSRLQPPAAGK